MERFKKSQFIVGDDQGYVRRLLIDILRGEGFTELTIVRSGAELLERTVELQPKIVLLTEALPDLSALEFTSHVRKG